MVQFGSASRGLQGPDGLLPEHARTLDGAYREVGGRLAVNTEVRVDDAGKIHLTGLKAVEEPPTRPPYDYRVWAVAFSPAGTRLATGNADDCAARDLGPGQPPAADPASRPAATASGRASEKCSVLLSARCSLDAGWTISPCGAGPDHTVVKNPAPIHGFLPVFRALRNLALS